MNPLLLDPKSYAPIGEYEIDEKDATKLKGLREDNRELSGWSLEQISNAWSHYSQDVYYAGYLDLFAGRNTQFIAYIYAIEHNLIENSQVSVDQQVSKVQDQLIADGYLEG